MEFRAGVTRGRQEALILPFWKGERPEPAFEGKALVLLVKPILQSGDFSGKTEEIFCLYPDKKPAMRLFLVGLGEKKAITSERIRRCYAQVVRLLRDKRIKSVGVEIPHVKSIKREIFLSALIEGMLLANYSFDQHISKKQNSLLEKIFLQGALSHELQLCKRNYAIASAVYLTRDLVIGNADEVTPTYLAQQATRLGKTFSSIHTQIFDRAQIKKENLHLLTAVSRGATTEPTFIVMQYKGNPSSSEITALIGKGITFDTGGLNLKGTGNIEAMRDDMAGGAVVLGTLQAAATLKIKQNLLGIIASTENAIGPSSYKPGDVYKSHAGLSVEISNTDAEGRLILADAISYAQTRFSPTRMIDIATLTGGAVIALGEEAAAICSNDDILSKQLIEAGQRTYERLWRLPLFEEYTELLKSKIADIKNSGPRKASTICGGIFLERFIKKGVPWAHLDIANVAFTESQKPYHPVQATGFGVRLLVSFLESL